MEKKELLAILEANATERGDHELEHVNCDDALLDYIDDPEITAAYEKGTKWYA